MSALITRSELAEEIDRGAVVVVETLGPQYFEQGHLPGAINIPHTDVADLAPSLLPDRDAAIVVYCSNPNARTRQSPRAPCAGWATATCASTPRASRTGRQPVYRSSRASRCSPSVELTGPGPAARSSAPRPAPRAPRHPPAGPPCRARAPRSALRARPAPRRPAPRHPRPRAPARACARTAPRTRAPAFPAGLRRSLRAPALPRARHALRDPTGDRFQVPSRGEYCRVVSTGSGPSDVRHTPADEVDAGRPETSVAPGPSEPAS